MFSLQANPCFPSKRIALENMERGCRWVAATPLTLGVCQRVLCQTKCTDMTTDLMTRAMVVEKESGKSTIYNPHCSYPGNCHSDQISDSNTRNHPHRITRPTMRAE